MTDMQDFNTEIIETLITSAETLIGDREPLNKLLEVFSAAISESTDRMDLVSKAFELGFLETLASEPETQIQALNTIIDTLADSESIYAFIDLAVKGGFAEHLQSEEFLDQLEAKIQKTSEDMDFIVIAGTDRTTLLAQNKEVKWDITGGRFQTITIQFRKSANSENPNVSPKINQVRDLVRDILDEKSEEAPRLLDQQNKILGDVHGKLEDLAQLNSRAIFRSAVDYNGDTTSGWAGIPEDKKIIIHDLSVSIDGGSKPDSGYTYDEAKPYMSLVYDAFEYARKIHEGDPLEKPSNGTREYFSYSEKSDTQITKAVRVFVSP